MGIVPITVNFCFASDQNASKTSDSDSKEDWRDAAGGALVRSRLAMGSNISQHSAKGLKGRRARSSGDLCNGEAKSQTESSVCGSVVGESMGWNRSLPNHLDGNRHLADYSRVNNNYGEFGTYNRCHTKSGRGLRYRVTKSGEFRESLYSFECNFNGLLVELVESADLSYFELDTDRAIGAISGI